VGNQLAGGSARIRETEIITDIVEASLQNLEHMLAGNAAPLEGTLVDTAELALQKAVVITKLLFFNEAKAVVSMLAAGLGAMNTRAVIAALEVLAGAKDRNAEPAADADTGTCITSHTKL
jgi:hypothetical protein